MTIKYLANFDTEMNHQQKRSYPLSAAAIKENGHNVEIISFASTRGEKSVSGKCHSTEDGCFRF